MHSTEITIKAQFYDVDAMEVVWHGNYVRFLEQARCELLNAVGYNYPQMHESGYLWPIVDLRIKFVRPIRFAQEFIVSATIIEFENRLKIAYRIRDKATGEVMTKATTTQVAVDAKTGELCLESPSALVEKLREP